MKRAAALLLSLSLLLTACNENRKTIDGITYDTFGLFNASDKQNSNIEYDIEWVNLVFAIVLFETVIVPVYVFGFDMFQPTGKKTGIRGQVPE